MEVLASNEPSSNLHAPDDDLCDSRSLSSVLSCLLTILHYNIRGFLSHRAELEIQISLLSSRSCLIFLNETFLDKSIQTVSLPGYRLIARRDRTDDSG